MSEEVESVEWSSDFVFMWVLKLNLLNDRVSLWLCECWSKNLESIALEIAMEGPNEGIDGITNDIVPLLKNDSKYRIFVC